ncbi:hypothetical protein AAFM48_23955 [Burkholderia pseudomallei]
MIDRQGEPILRKTIAKEIPRKRDRIAGAADCPIADTEYAGHPREH